MTNIYTSSKPAPYVYVCTHTITGKFYIGYRESNVSQCIPSNIDLPLYKTSSKLVRPNFHEYTWQVIAEFLTGEAAYEFEQYLIHENWDNPLLLNQYNQYNKRQWRRTAPPWNKGTKGLQNCTDETKDKIRKARANQQITVAAKSKISKSLLGNTRSKKLRTEETKQAIKEKLAERYKTTPKVLGMLGKVHSESTKSKMQLAQQARRAKEKTNN